MAHLLEFSIDGLAGKKGTYAKQLNRDVNIFFGSNGSGKTSLLKILHSAMENNAAILGNVPFKKAEVKLHSATFDMILDRTISQSLSVPVVGEQSEMPSDATTVTSQTKKIEWSTSPKQPVIGGLSHSYLPISRLYSGGLAPQLNAYSYNLFSPGAGLGMQVVGYSEDDLNKRFAESVQHIWRTYAADISRAVREAQQKGLTNILKAVLSGTTKAGKKKSLLDSEQAYRRVSSFLGRQAGLSNILGSSEQFQKKYLADQNLRNVVRDIEEVETNIENATAPREELRNVIKSMFVGGKDVAFSDKSIEVRIGDLQIGLPLLSSGEKQLLYILIEGLAAGVNTILIDEPEISMHVDWQKALVRTIRTLNPKVQIIMATHSPEIMADVDDRSIFRL